MITEYMGLVASEVIPHRLLAFFFFSAFSHNNWLGQTDTVLNRRHPEGERKAGRTALQMLARLWSAFRTLRLISPEDT